MESMMHIVGGTARPTKEDYKNAVAAIQAIMGPDRAVGLPSEDLRAKGLEVLAILLGPPEHLTTHTNISDCSLQNYPNKTKLSEQAEDNEE